MNKNIANIYKGNKILFGQPLLINNGDATSGYATSANKNVLIRNKRSPEPKPFGFFRRSGYYGGYGGYGGYGYSQPYNYGYRYSTGRGFGAGYGSGYRGYGGYGYGGYGNGGYGYGRGRLLRAAVVVGGAALAGGLIGSSLRGK